MPHPLRALFLDMDSFFASAEQHFNPSLRGKAVAVAPMLAESTCCIASSYEAKAHGVKTGTRVSEARLLCPGIIILAAQPPRYVELHHQIIAVVESCLHVDHVLSIDEMVCWLPENCRSGSHLQQVASTIKTRLEETFSPAVRCSIGVAPNGWLAKTASKMSKPDGFLIIRDHELPNILYPLPLTDLHGIGKNRALRLHSLGIHTTKQLCHAPKEILRSAWGGVQGEHLWYKLRGECLEEVPSNRQKQSLSHGHVLAPDMRPPDKAEAILHRIMQKAALRLRHEGLYAAVLDLQLSFQNGKKWSGAFEFIETNDTLFFSQHIQALWQQRPYPKEPVKRINLILHKLCRDTQFTPSLFEQKQGQERRARLNQSMDSINQKFGKRALYLGSAHGAMESLEAKIAFHHIPDTDIEA